jgi:proteasome lid subunit RPN8/RPN11
MEEGGGLNVYMMVGNSNVSGFDLLGLSSSFIPNSGCSKCSFADIERVSAEYLNIANEKTSHAGPIFRNKYTLWQEFGARICCDPERKEVFSAGIIDGIIDFENGVPVMYVPFKNSPRTCESARAKAYEVARIHSHPPNSPVLSEQDMSNNWIYMVTQQGGVSRFFRSRRGKTDDGKNVIEKCERIKGEWVCNIIPL